MNRTTRICILVATPLIVGGCSGRQAEDATRIVEFPTVPENLIKVMSFNIRVDTFLDGLNGWNNRKQRVFEILADHAADVVSLQEALNHQVRQIQQALPQYSHYAAGRVDGKLKGESCAIFYRKDRFALADSGTFWFSETPNRPGSKDWGNLWPRICSWVYLKEKATGAGFYVFNVHLDVFSQNSRARSVELLARRVAARTAADPFIVMGDFNMGLANPAMLYLQNTDSQTPYPRMVSAWQSLHPGRPCQGTRHNFRGRPSGPKIDHIPICDDARALEVEIDRRDINGRYPSDHFPVIATVLFTREPKPLEPVAARTDLSSLQPN